jgi:hypothetical protein
VNQRATPKGEFLNKDDSIFLDDGLDKQRAGSLILPSITDRNNTYNEATTMPQSSIDYQLAADTLINKQSDNLDPLAGNSVITYLNESVRNDARV